MFLVLLSIIEMYNDSFILHLLSDIFQIQTFIMYEKILTHCTDKSCSHFTYLCKNCLTECGDAPNLKIEATKERLQRDNYLANFVSACMDCHSKSD